MTRAAYCRARAEMYRQHGICPYCGQAESPDGNQTNTP